MTHTIKIGPSSLNFGTSQFASKNDVHAIDDTAFWHNECFTGEVFSPIER